MKMAKTTHAAIIKSHSFYDEPRELYPHEQDLLLAIRFAGKDRDACVGAAVTLFGDKSQAYWVTVNLANRSEAAALDKALAAYIAAEDDYYNHEVMPAVTDALNAVLGADELYLIDLHQSQAAE
jgi:hypothetical protein